MKPEFHGFLRVGEKIQLADFSSTSWRHDWHNLRLSEKSAPSADPSAPSPEILVGDPAGLKASIEKVLAKVFRKFGTKPYGKSSVLVGELVYTAAADYFGGKGYQNWNQETVTAWRDAVMKMLAKVFGERIVAIIFHQDESAPHLHVYVMPLVQHKSRPRWNPNGRKARYADGQYKLSSRAFFTRSNLIKWQDEYGFAIQPLGLLRGRRGSEATHKQMRDAQRDLEIARVITEERNRSLETATQTANMVIGDNEFARDALRAEKAELERARKRLEAIEATLATERAAVAEKAQQLKLAQSRLEDERSRLRAIPIADVAAKLGFVDSGDGELRATLPHYTVQGVEFLYRLLITEGAFRVDAWHRIGPGGFDWVKQGAGKGAIDFLRALMPKQPISEVCDRLATLFPENQPGIVSELLEAANPELWTELARKDPDMVSDVGLQAADPSTTDPSAPRLADGPH